MSVCDPLPNTPLQPLPLSVLAGLVIGAVVSLVDVRAPLLYCGWSRRQFFVGIVTVFSTMTLAPRVARLKEDTLHVRPSRVLYFGSAPSVERTINALLAEHPEVRRLVMHLDPGGRLDLTGALMLRDVLEDLEAAGREFQICGARAHSARLLTRVLGFLLAADDAKGDSP